jgi:hypothetical protein
VLVVQGNRDPRANKALLVLRAAKAIRGRPVFPEWWERKESKVSPVLKGHKASKDLPVRKAGKEIRDHLARPGQLCMS